MHDQNHSIASSSKRRRGRRIKQTAWPGILKLYQDGATLTAIARIYDCTPSAICYIVKKAERIYGDLTQFSKASPIDPATMAAAPASWSVAESRPNFDMPFDPIAEAMLHASRHCLRSYRAWRSEDNMASRYSLSQSVMEMHRLLSRIELELTGTTETNAPQSPTLERP